MVRELKLSFSATDLAALFAAVASEPWFGFEGNPPSWKIDGAEHVLGDDWRSVVPGLAKSSVYASFGERFISLLLDPGNCLLVGGPYPLAAATLCEVMCRLPCTLVAVSWIHREWRDDERRPPNRNLGEGHYVYGPFVGFKGPGHDRLLSRRWLRHAGPWRLHTAPNDVSLLQLHDLAADASTALAQFIPCQERLGPSDTGGLASLDFKRKLKLDVQYSGRDRKASIVVAKREVTPREMLEAARLRGSAVLGDDAPVDAVAFVYLDEAQARRDLHELWLRGLECWAYLDGVETRLDEAYAPPAAKPGW
jgi:hypothetical protein